MHAGNPAAVAARKHHKLSGLCQFERAGLVDRTTTTLC